MLAGARPQYVDEVFEHSFRRDGGYEHRLDITYSSLPATVESWVQRVGFRTDVLGLDAEWKPVHVKGVKPVLALLQLSTEHSALVIQLNALRGGASRLGELCPRLASLLSGQYHAEASSPSTLVPSLAMGRQHPDAVLSAVVGAADGASHESASEADGNPAGGAGAAAMPVQDGACVLESSRSAEAPLIAARHGHPSRRLRVCGVGITADYAKTLSDCGIAPYKTPPLLVNLAALKKGGPKGLAAIAIAAKAVDATWKRKSLQMCNWEDWPLSRPKVVYAAMDAYAGAAAYVRLRPSAAAPASAWKSHDDGNVSSAGGADDHHDDHHHHHDQGAGEDADCDAPAEDSDHYLESGAESDTPAPAAYRRHCLGAGRGEPGAAASGTVPRRAESETRAVHETAPGTMPGLAYFALDKCGY